MSKLKDLLDAVDARSGDREPGFVAALLKKLRSQRKPQTRKRVGNTGNGRNRAESRAEEFGHYAVMGGGSSGVTHHRPRQQEKRSRRGRRRKAAIKTKARRARHA